MPVCDIAIYQVLNNQIFVGFIVLLPKMSWMFIYLSPMTDSSGINEGREDLSENKQLMLETDLSRHQLRTIMMSAVILTSIVLALAEGFHSPHIIECSRHSVKRYVDFLPGEIYPLLNESLQSVIKIHFSLFYHFQSHTPATPSGSEPTLTNTKVSQVRR